MPKGVGVRVPERPLMGRWKNTAWWCEMSDLISPDSIVIACSDWQQIVSATNRIIPELSLDLRRQLNSVFSNYLAAYGLEGVFERMNGKTVTQILNEYRDSTSPPVVAKGELEGVRFTLYEAPRPNES